MSMSETTSTKYRFPGQSESIRPIRKKCSISFAANHLQINPTQSETSIRMNPNQIFNLNQSEHGFNRGQIASDLFVLVRADFGMIEIDRIEFLSESFAQDFL